MWIFLIALGHALIIFVFSVAYKSKRVLWISTVISLLIAISFGASEFLIYDLVAIVIAFLAAKKVIEAANAEWIRKYGSDPLPSRTDIQKRDYGSENSEPDTNKQSSSVGWIVTPILLAIVYIWFYSNEKGDNEAKKPMTTQKINAALKESARKTNAGLPLNLGEIVWVSQSAGYMKVMNYYRYKSLPSTKVEQYATTKGLACADVDIKRLLRLGVSINYYYKDKNNNSLFDFNVDSNACENNRALATTTPIVSRQTKNTNLMLIKDIQNKLSILGYQPGPIDGVFGARTRTAITNYQREHGLEISGLPSNILLQGIISTLKTQTNNSTAAKQQILQPISKPSYFTHGSSRDELIAVQGHPDSVEDLSQYREKWKYGISSVSISKQSGNVLAWNNNGGLRAKQTITDSTQLERVIGQWSKKVEDLALSRECLSDGSPDLQSTQGDIEYYRVFCRDLRIIKITCDPETCI